MKNFKKKLFLILLIGLSQVSVAASFNCYRQMLNNFSVDSKSFQIHSEDVTVLFENEPVVAVSQSIRMLEERFECSNKSIGAFEVSCRELVPGKYLSQVCYAQSEDGYFFVSLDLMGNINIIFNRWD